MRPLKSVSREQVLFAAVMTTVPILLCGFLFGFDIPLASARFWSVAKNDMISMTAAYEAFVRQPWTFPLGMVSGLLPKPVSIVFTDSIPWLSILLKALGLGGVFNPLGLFLALSYPLQAWGMATLLRALGVEGRVPLLLGAVLALTYPSWLARQFGHIALSGHWLILFALALSVASARFGLSWRRIGGFAALAALATGVHAYHLVPIGACFGAALLSELMQARPLAWRRVPLAALAVLAAVGVSAVVLGYGEGRGPTGGAAALGFYAMNLLGPVLPQASALLGQRWDGAWFSGVVDPTGGQAFEGYQYMGAGALLLLAVAALGLAARRVRGERAPAGALARWAPLALAMLALTVWAVGWEIYYGTHLVASLPRPGGALAELVGGFRAYGRFFWAPGYLLLALSVAAAARLPFKLGVSLLAAATLLQIADTSGLRQGVRSVFAGPDRLDIPARAFETPALRGRPWVFAPTYFCSPSHKDLRVMNQWILAAVRTGGTTNTFSTARTNDAPCEQLPADIGRDAAPGDRRITVTMANGQLLGGFLQPLAARSDCYRTLRGVICGRDLEGLGLQRVIRGELSDGGRVGRSLRLDRTPPPAGLRSGWAKLDPGGKGLWTLGHRAVFELRAPPSAATRDFFVDVVAIGFSDMPLRPQHVTLYAGDRRLNSVEVGPTDFGAYRFRVPGGAFQPDQLVTFAFDLPDARASLDRRVLGIGVQEIMIRE